MSAQSIALHHFTAPAVRETRPALEHSSTESSRELRRPRRKPYHRATQRELVRMSLALDFSDYHGDRAGRI